MCVHQACYGIEHIPQGSWLCAPCDFGGPQFRPECVLCPNSSVGAMKATKNYRHWAHVSCALWMPEVGFGDLVKMEPIINLNKIPPAKWQLTCSLCKEKRGCCLQCAEKKCHLAFHVTCAFKFNLELKNHQLQGGGASSGGFGANDYEPSVVGGAESAQQFKAYCLRHTKKRQLLKNAEQDDEEDEDEKENLVTMEEEESEIKLDYENAASKLESIDGLDGDDEEECEENDERLLNLLTKMNENERKFEIIKRIQLLNKHFYKNVNLNLAKNLAHVKNQMHIDMVFNYWKLKRRFNVMTITSIDNTVSLIFFLCLFRVVR
jgi:hypothetical protein